MLKGYNPHSSLYGVCEKQTSGSIDLLILLLNVARYLFQHLEQNRMVQRGERGTDLNVEIIQI